jgi:hypothetical protein
MSGGTETEFINKWIDELETLIYEFKLPPQVIEQTRRVLTRAIEAGLGGSGHPGAYLALACFYLACRMTPRELQLDSLLMRPLGEGLTGQRLTDSVKSIQFGLGLRICSKCGVRPDSSEKFCSACGKWIPYNVISNLEEQRCQSFQ